MNKVFEKIIEGMQKIAVERQGNIGMGGELVVNLDDGIDIVQRVASEYNNGWIPCSERLPEVKINPVTNDYERYNIIYKNGDVYDVRTYAYGEASGGKHWLNSGTIMDDYVIEWQPLPEGYKES